MYIDILRRLRDAVRRKRPEKWRANNWFLLHDNAPAHRSVSANDFLAKNNATTLKHPPYSPILASVEFYLLRLKSALKGHHLFDAINVIKNTTKELNGFHKMTSRNVLKPFTVGVRIVFFAQGDYLGGNVA